MAWVAERKDVLSTAFVLFAMLAYTRYARRGTLLSYLATLGLMGCSLLSKPTFVTLPALLLLLDYWPLDRLRGAGLRRCLLDKLPMIALSAAASITTMATQSGAGALEDGSAVVLGDRIANAIWSYGIYLRKTVWPLDLAGFYPDGFPRNRVRRGLGRSRRR